MSVIVCYTRCWACMVGECPGGWHTWADAEDVANAEHMGHPDPRAQKCACACTEREVATTQPTDEDVIWATVDPCPVCGEYGSCATDAEGRPLFHATPDDDEETTP